LGVYFGNEGKGLGSHAQKSKGIIALGEIGSSYKYGAQIDAYFS
jgi:hypothetical protein